MTVMLAEQRLSMAPLMAILERRAALIEAETDRGGWKELSLRLGFSAYTLAGWHKRGLESLARETAERVVCALDLLMSDVWSDDELEGRKAA